jgi:hypothetical protein
LSNQDTEERGGRKKTKNATKVDFSRLSRLSIFAPKVGSEGREQPISRLLLLLLLLLLLPLRVGGWGMFHVSKPMYVGRFGSRGTFAKVDMNGSIYLLLTNKHIHEC